MEIYGDSSSNDLGSSSKGAGAGSGFLLSHRRSRSGPGRDRSPVPQGVHTQEDPAGGAGKTNLRGGPKRNPPGKLLSPSPAHAPAATTAAPPARLVSQFAGLPGRQREDPRGLEGWTADR